MVGQTPDGGGEGGERIEKLEGDLEFRFSFMY